MAYRIAGRATELCSCNAPCPCAFGQLPTGGRCRALMVFDVKEGNADGVSLAGTKAIVAAEFPGVWSKGNWTAALILDSQASQQQRDALQRILTGQMKGDAAAIAALIGTFKGVATAPISITFAGGTGPGMGLPKALLPRERPLSSPPRPSGERPSGRGLGMGCSAQAGLRERHQLDEESSLQFLAPAARGCSATHPPDPLPLIREGGV